MLSELNFAELHTADGRAALLDSLRVSGAVILSDAIPVATETAVMDAGRVLFDLPDSVKSACTESGVDEPGFGSYGNSRAMDSGIPNLLESWRISPLSNAGLPRDTPDTTWYRFRELAGYLRLISSQVLTSIDEEWSASGRVLSSVADSTPMVNILHYPRSLVEAKPDGARRQSVHTDASVISILPRASAPGLRILCDDREYGAHPPPGGVVVLAGSVLGFLSGGYLKACRHTVAEENSDGEIEDRLSLVCFIGPVPGARIEKVLSERGLPEGGQTLDTDEHMAAYMSRIFGPRPRE